MISPWYLMMGMFTLMYHFIKHEFKQDQVDWTKQMNPFSPEGQAMMAVGLFVFVFLWPIIWVADLVEMLGG